MSQQFPDEIIDLYGTMAVSRIATARTKAVYATMPKFADALKTRPPAQSKQISIDDLDVENGGMDDEFEDFMREGFEGLIPGGPTGKPFPPIPLPPPDPCGQIRRALATANEELATQLEQQARLQALVDALGKSAHPLIVIFAALFKLALEEVSQRVQDLIAEVALWTTLGNQNDCF